MSNQSESVIDTEKYGTGMRSGYAGHARTRSSGCTSKAELPIAFFEPTREVFASEIAALGPVLGDSNSMIVSEFHDIVLPERNTDSLRNARRLFVGLEQTGELIFRPVSEFIELRGGYPDP